MCPASAAKSPSVHRRTGGSLSPLPPGPNGPTASGAGARHFIGEHTGNNVFTGQVVSRQAAWTVLHQQLRAGALGHQFVAQADSDAAPRRFYKRLWNLHAASYCERTLYRRACVVVRFGPDSNRLSNERNANEIRGVQAGTAQYRRDKTLIRRGY